MWELSQWWWPQQTVAIRWCMFCFSVRHCVVAGGVRDFSHLHWGFPPLLNWAPPNHGFWSGTTPTPTKEWYGEWDLAEAKCELDVETKSSQITRNTWALAKCEKGNDSDRRHCKKKNENVWSQWPWQNIQRRSLASFTIWNTQPGKLQKNIYCDTCENVVCWTKIALTTCELNLTVSTMELPKMISKDGDVQRHQLISENKKKPNVSYPSFPCMIGYIIVINTLGKLLHRLRWWQNTCLHHKYILKSPTKNMMGKEWLLWHPKQDHS